MTDDNHLTAIAHSRRNILKWIGLASAAVGGLGARQVLSASRTNSSHSLDRMTEVDVVVIGGGFAGVTAAREVKRAGLKVILLEARNRLGGRTFYSKFGDDPVELGGECVHWFQPNVWSEILHYGLSITEIPGWSIEQRLLWISNGQLKQLSPDQSSAVLSELTQKFNAEATKIFPRPYDNFYNADLVRKYDGLSILDRINQLNLPREQADLIQSLMESYASSSAREAAYLDAVKWWALAGNNLDLVNDTWERYRFKDGTISLINAIIEDTKVPVVLSAPVSNINQHATGVEVLLQGGKVVKAKRAIVAVPLNVLQHIQFKPSLVPSRLEASKETHAGHGQQVFMRVKGPMPAFFALAPEPEPLSSIWLERTGEQNSLLGAEGSNSALLDIHSALQVQNVLRKYFPNAEVEETIGYDWALDPFSRGTWCVYRPHQLTRYLKDLQEPQGNVHFASADWANGWRGFMDGAIERGRHVGLLVARSYRS
jgi:pseudooxynicotine oxidase